MAVPKKRTSVARKGKRRAGHTHKLSAKATSNCKNCGGVVLSHYVCPSCGYYNDREVIAMETETEEESTEA